jgi:hypothetical protein
MKRTIQTLLVMSTLSLASCLSISSQPKLFVFSDPDGATVLFDGKDTGFTTPAAIDRCSGTVTVEKEGYATQSRPVVTRTDFRYPRWQDGGTSDYTIAFCLFRTWRDFFFPFQFYTHDGPERLYFKLQTNHKK